MNQTEMMQLLIKRAYEGPVFGLNGAFGGDASHKLPIVLAQIAAIAQSFNTDLREAIMGAVPTLTNQDLNRILQEIGPKAVGFCPALTAGELPGDVNTRYLAGAAKAIGLMYFADQSVDRGDELMTLAIEAAFGGSTERSDTESRVQALRGIRSAIETFALPEDAPLVTDCYEQQVLYNEVKLHHHSQAYQPLSKAAQYNYLDKNAREIAELMIIDAGFPSVTASLYAIYRQNDASLPSLSVVHNDQVIKALLRVCNTVVRVADELGDWEIDAGQHPEWGVFAINPLNQYHPVLVGALCEAAQIVDRAMIAEVQQAFANFHGHANEREALESFLTDIFFGHMRHYIEQLPSETLQQHQLYITLCKRVLEIGHVNMMGDKALAGL